MLKNVLFRVKKHLYREMDKNDIDIETLYKMKMEGATIIDVRSKREYNEGHIEDSINIPDYEINKTIENVIKDYNQIIILYCSSGTRSKKACKNLVKKGYFNVYNLYEGITF